MKQEDHQLDYILGQNLISDISGKLTTKYLFISVIDQLDAQKVCFTISLFHARNM